MNVIREHASGQNLTMEQLLLLALQQMQHVEFAKDEKLADTIPRLVCNTKARQAVYAQQLRDTEAALLAAPPEMAAYSALTSAATVSAQHYQKQLAETESEASKQEMKQHLAEWWSASSTDYQAAALERKCYHVHRLQNKIIADVDWLQ
ncbi:hypothetical protein ABBQ38_000769 [Trebouxia sp. C0009 RCD-2024]